MSEFICKKAISLSGKKYVPGERIPAGAIDDRRVLALTRSNYVVAVEENASVQEDSSTAISGGLEQDLINLPIVTSEGLLTATVSHTTAATAFLIIQKAESEAKAAIEDCDDDEALALVDAADRRKAVLKAVSNRRAVLADAALAKTEAGDAVEKDV